jgi:hypothetical protein
MRRPLALLPILCEAQQALCCCVNLHVKEPEWGCKGLPPKAVVQMKPDRALSCQKMETSAAKR